MAGVTLSGWPSGATVNAYVAATAVSMTPDTDALGSSVASGAASSAGQVTLGNLPPGRYVASDGATRRSFVIPSTTVDLLNRLTVGEETIPRLNASSSATMSSGVLRLVFFTAAKTETITQLRVVVGSTPAAATPTLIRFGVYSVAASGDIALLASTPNDTTLLTVAQTSYSKALSAPWVKVAGTRYAIGGLVVTAAAAPNLYGIVPLNTSEMTLDPRVAASVGSQADLPGSVLNASVAAANATLYVACAP